MKPKKYFILIALLFKLTISIITPPLEYTVAPFQAMAANQTNFVLDSWLVKQAWVNPSMIADPNNHHRVIMAR